MKFDKDIFSDIIKDQTPENAMIIQTLIDELAFILDTLDKLKKSVQTDGAVIEKQTGNGYKTLCENPALKGYNTTIKSYTSTCKALAQYTPEPKQAMDEFMQFITERRPTRQQ